MLLQTKEKDLNYLCTTSESLARSGNAEDLQVKEKVEALCEGFNKMMDIIQQRIKLAMVYVAFHKSVKPVDINFKHNLYIKPNHSVDRGSCPCCVL